MANENPFLLSLSIMWFRHHNWWARRLRDEHPEWDDYMVFFEARIHNVATMQVGYCDTKIFFCASLDVTLPLRA